MIDWDVVALPLMLCGIVAAWTLVVAMAGFAAGRKSMTSNTAAIGPRICLFPKNSPEIVISGDGAEEALSSIGSGWISPAEAMASMSNEKPAAATSRKNL